MSRCEDIDNAIWDDPDFEALSANATLLYIWSWTNPRCGMAGVYKVSLARMGESKVSLDMIPAVLDELREARFLFYEDSVLWVRSRVKRLRARSPKMARSVAKDIEKLPPEHPIRLLFLDEYHDTAWLRDALADTYREGMDTVSKKPIGKGNSHTLSVPSLEGPGTGTGSSTDRSKASGTDTVVDHARARVELPAEFPEELRPHLVAVFRTLRALSERHKARAVSPLSLAQVVMARPRKPLVRAAYDFASWADGKAQRRKDVVGGYRRWLDNTDDLACLEELDEDGLPAASAANVVPFSRKPTTGDKIRRIKAAEAAERDGEHGDSA